MSARHVVFALALACSLGSCTEDLPPRGQIVLFVDTDAPVPQAREAERDFTRLAPLVDRARFDVLVDGKPLVGSSREFDLNETSLREREVSIGVVSAPGDGAVSVRVRLFRADRVRAQEPPAGTTLETLVTLPAVGEDGITAVSVVLRADDFGKIVGPIPATPGKPTQSSVNTWRGGRHVACAGEPTAREACVPGGSFFMGDPSFRGRTFANDITDERLVWLSPYYLDRTEVTVGAFRARWPELAAGGAAPPLAFFPSRDSGEEKDYCTWSDQPLAGSVGGVKVEDLPLSCVSWTTARAYCLAVGGDLPTEAQLEYAASGRGAEWAYPWGDDEPACSFSVWGLGGNGAYGEGSKACRSAGIQGWAAYPGSGTRDRVDPTPENGGDPEIVDLGGNLSEWALDMWSRASEGFWSSVAPMNDPLANVQGADGDRHAARGGSWPYTALTTRAAFRVRRGPDERVANVGFRCARAAGTR
jgi:formylglycine-generating enzyme